MVSKKSNLCKSDQQNFINAIENCNVNLNPEKFIIPPKGFSKVSCPDDPFVIALFGQSNSSNTVSEKMNDSFQKNLIQFNWLDGNCYKYAEPLLPFKGGGNAISYMAKYISEKSKKDILIIGFGIPDTSVLDWAYRDKSKFQDFVLRQINASGIKPNVFFWHQGERDSRAIIYEQKYIKNLVNFLERLTLPKYIYNKLALGLPSDIYEDALNIVINRLNNKFPNSKVGIALATKCDVDSFKTRVQWEPIRESQRKVARSNINTFISADSDKIYDVGDRFECHFTRVGAKKLSQEYINSLYKNNIFSEDF